MALTFAVGWGTRAEVEYGVEKTLTPDQLADRESLSEVFVIVTREPATWQTITVDNFCCDTIDVPPHVDYPHFPGMLYNCPACEWQCYCADGEECVKCEIDSESR